MSLAAIFVLTLLGGYNFADKWAVSRATTRRHDGQHVYMRAGLYGAILFIVAYLIEAALRTHCDSYGPWETRTEIFLASLLTSSATQATPEPGVPAHVFLTAIFSLMLGILTPQLLNALMGLPGIKEFFEWSLFRRRFSSTASELDLLLRNAQDRMMPVSVTLKNGKVYVGVVQKITDPERSPAAFRLLPMLSGQRDESGRTVFVTDYSNVYEQLENMRETERKTIFGLSGDWEQYFEVVIRADEWVSATLFSAEVYARFNPGWKEALSQPAKS